MIELLLAGSLDWPAFLKFADNYFKAAYAVRRQSKFQQRGRAAA
jgi:hypothetical protein